MKDILPRINYYFAFLHLGIAYSFALLSFSNHVSADNAFSKIWHLTADDIVAEISLPKHCFTQGFLIRHDQLYLSCGRYGQSAVYRYAFQQEKLSLEGRYTLPAKLFAEGIALLQQQLMLLTWKSQSIIMLDSDALSPTANILTAHEELWGLSDDGRNGVLLSDGSHQVFHYQHDQLYPILLPAQSSKKTFAAFSSKPSAALPAATHVYQLYWDRKLITAVNELEYIHDQLWFNQWQSHFIYRVSLDVSKHQQQAEKIDISVLVERHQKDGVANGIAFDQRSQRLWLTGKNWGKAYAIPIARLSR